MQKHPTRLWRINDGHDPQLVARDILARGLQVHLQYAPLTSVFIHGDARQQRYVYTLGCPTCQLGRCRVGCYSELLGRLLATALPGSRLQLVPHGLARRPYRRVVLAWPGAAAQPLVGGLMASWPEGRLIQQWSGHRNHIRTATLLAVGENGPDPVAMLRAHGWRAWRSPAWFGLTLAKQAMPPALPFPRPWHGRPHLLLEAMEAQHADALPLPQKEVMLVS